MTQEQINILINSFHCWYNDGTKKIGARTMVPRCAEAGFAPDPEILNESVLNFVLSQTFNPNSTFYSTWHEVESKDRFELMLDQLMHYASTYGTDYETEAWSPNDDPIHLFLQDYTVIKAVSKDDIAERVLTMLTTGIALKSEMVDALCTFLIEGGYEVDIDSISNFEALCILASNSGILPTNSALATRVVWYMISGQSQIVQNYWDMSMAIKDCSPVRGLNEKQLTILSESFLRYKTMWMAIRQHTGCQKAVNRLRQLARTHHKPMKVGFWEKFSQLEGLSEETIQEQVNKLDNPFKIVKLIEMCILRTKQNRSRTSRIFIIRNGKVWVDEDKFADLPTQFPIACRMLLERLVMGLSNARKANNPTGQTSIKLPEHIQLAVPSSAKNFYGNYPFGSYIEMGADSFVGVYWRNEWGTRDFDISFIDYTGHKIGWDADYNANSVLYSGDLTDAKNGASEILSFRKGAPKGLVFLNRYNGEVGSKFITFAGAGETKREHGNGMAMGRGRNYMVDPNDIHAKAEARSTKAGQVIGAMYNERLYFMQFDWNQQIASRDEKALITSMHDRTTAHLMLKDVLEAAGYLVVGTKHWKEHEKEITSNLDISDVTADSILELLKF